MSTATTTTIPWGHTEPTGRGLSFLTLLRVELRKQVDTRAGRGLLIAIGVLTALALGLADIVMGEAGGVQMETLFIDEGFGSLDPETLETVVREIGRLAESGRTVGIVSHVGDMKSQIAEQIHVRRGADARSTLTVTA